jgi:hypothetical protein
MIVYTITLRPLKSDVPTIIRIRAILKYALRACKLMCIDIKETEVPD